MLEDGNSRVQGAVVICNEWHCCLRRKELDESATAAQLVKFFKTGKPPVAAEETIEIYAMMEAADESKRQGSRMVSIEEVLEKAQKHTVSQRVSSR